MRSLGLSQGGSFGRAFLRKVEVPKLGRRGGREESEGMGLWGRRAKCRRAGLRVAREWRCGVSAMPIAVSI